MRDDFIIDVLVHKLLLTPSNRDGRQQAARPYPRSRTAHTYSKKPPSQRHAAAPREKTPGICGPLNVVPRSRASMVSKRGGGAAASAAGCTYGEYLHTYPWPSSKRKNLRQAQRMIYHKLSGAQIPATRNPGRRF